MKRSFKIASLILALAILSLGGAFVFLPIFRVGDSTYINLSKVKSENPDILTRLTDCKNDPVIGADRRPTGFRLRDIPPESLLRRLGFEDGDVVKKFNGRQVESIVTLAQDLNRKIEAKERIEIEFVRNENNRTFVFNLR